MIIHNSKSTDGHREAVCPLFETVLDPFFAIVGLIAQQERSAHTAGHAVIPARYRRINQASASDRHGRKLLVVGNPHTMHARSVTLSSLLCWLVDANPHGEWLNSFLQG